MEVKEEREKRGRGVRRRVAAEYKCPSNWSQFLKDELNKKELNEFHAETLTALTYPSSKEIFITHQDKVLTNFTAIMENSDIEEADSRMMLLVKDALMQNMTFIYIISNDTDVSTCCLSSAKIRAYL